MSVQSGRVLGFIVGFVAAAFVLDARSMSPIVVGLALFGFGFGGILLGQALAMLITRGRVSRQ